MPLEAQLKSMRAFAPIHQFVVNEPRCVNCHGAVNPHVDTPGPDPDNPDEVPSTVPHGPGPIDRFVEPDAQGRREMEVSCIGCHDGMAPKRNGSKSRWFTAPGFLSFLNKDAIALCKQFKRTTGSADEFIGHVIDDNGADAFTKTAFLGNRGVDGLAPIPPSISHAALIRMSRDWIAAMGGQFKGDEACGCDPKIKGKFTSIDTSPMDTTRITGDLEWKLELPPGGGAPPPGAPLVFKPKSGEITVQLSFSAPGIASTCDGLGRKTFPVDSLRRGALRHMKLEIREDGSYEVTLVIPDDRPDPFPTWSIEAECSFPNVSHRQPAAVKNQSVVLGKHSGTVDPERGIVGELKNPIRRGPRTITGNWSFATQSQ